LTSVSASRPPAPSTSALRTSLHWDFERPPTAGHTRVDLDMPKSWSPFQLELINLGSGRFCVVKISLSTRPHLKLKWVSPTRRTATMTRHLTAVSDPLEVRDLDWH
jgi:hypothetical protein